MCGHIGRRLLKDKMTDRQTRLKTLPFRTALQAVKTCCCSVDLLSRLIALVRPEKKTGVTTRLPNITDLSWRYNNSVSTVPVVISGRSRIFQTGGANHKGEDERRLPII